METILVVNAGSSSLKFQVFALGALSAIRFPCCREMSRGHWSARTLHDVRPVDLVVTELAVIGFPEGRATLLETGPGASVAQVVAATEAELVIPDQVPAMRLCHA
jgi:hypothetical protein